MSSVSNRRLLVKIAVIVLIAGGGLAWWYYDARVPKRFAPVVDGRLYRSGTVSPRQLEYLHNEYGIDRVISLLDPNHPDSVAERTAAEQLGIEWHNVPLRGNGASKPADRVRIVELLREADAPPTLVHCAAGANRTGLAVGLYRIHFQDWTYAQVLAEMKRFDFEDLPKHENLRQALRAATTQAASGPTGADDPGASNKPEAPSGELRPDEEEEGRIGRSMRPGHRPGWRSGFAVARRFPHVADTRVIH